MSSAQGRFTSPDAPFNDQQSSDPQGWNYTHTAAIIRLDSPIRQANTASTVAATCTTTNDKGGQSCAEAVDPKNNNQPSVTVVGNRDGSTSGFDQSGAQISFLPYNPAIKSAPDELLNVVPFVKLGLTIRKIGLTVGPLAAVIGKEALQHILARHTANTAAQTVSTFAARLSKDAIEGLI